MAYYDEAPTVKAQIQSTKGETIDLQLPETCTIQELLEFLISTYSYSPQTRFWYQDAMVPLERYVCEYPYGSLMLATPADIRQRQAERPHGRQMPPPPDNTSPQQPPDAQRSIPHHRQPRGGGSRTTTEPAPPQPVDTPSPTKHKAPRKGANNHPQRRSISSEKDTRDSDAAPDGEQPGSKPTSPSQGGKMPPSATREPLKAPTPPPQAPLQAPQQQQQQQPQQEPQGPPPAAPSQPQQQAPPPPQQPLGQGAPTAAQGGATPAAPAEDENSHWERIVFQLTCHVPALNKIISMEVNANSSVADILLVIMSALPEVAGNPKIIYKGKVLPATPESKLFNLGLRSDCRVFIASGKYSNPDAIVLLEIEEDVTQIEAIPVETMTEQQRKGYYEELMRILLRTDGLMDLENEWKLKRKEMVKRITALQDKINPGHHDV